PYHLSDAEAWIATLPDESRPGQDSFAIDLAGIGYVGHLGFHQHGDQTGIGYWLGQPYWGQGIMTEAVAAAVKWLFATTDFVTIHSGVFHFNHASLAVQSKLGFTKTGRSSLVCLARGVEVEHIDTQLTRERFQHMREARRT